MNTPILFKANVAAVLLALLVTSASSSAKPPLQNLEPTYLLHLYLRAIGKAIQTTTDKNGNAVFDKLEPGKYVLSVDAPKTKEAIGGEAHGWLRGHAQSTNENGVQVVTVSFTPDAGNAANPPPLDIEITARQGQITVHVGDTPLLSR